MSFKFNADEVFEIVEQIERNGKAFYQKAADFASDEESANMFTELAEMEAVHERFFARMRQQLKENEKEPQAFDPYDESLLYLRALADAKVFKTGADAGDGFSTDMSLEEIIQAAIEREKDAVVLFVGLKAFTHGIDSKNDVESIIQEEMGHIGMLTLRLATV